MAKTNAQVNIVEIEVEGIRYTQTRPGYYYKRVDGKSIRIKKDEWDAAFEASVQTAADNADADGWDMEQEIAQREAARAESDKVAEDAMNGKAKKVRKSKDIAFTTTAQIDGEEKQITLTAKQVDFIKHIPDTCFYENGLDSCPWCDVLADEIGGQFAGKPMTVGAMISTLREKGIIYVGQDKINGKKAKFFGFTEIGKQVAQELGLN